MRDSGPVPTMRLMCTLAISLFVPTGESLTQAHPGRLKFSKPVLSADLGFRSGYKILKMGIKRPETRAGLSSGSDERRQARGASTGLRYPNCSRQSGESEVLFCGCN